MAAASASTSSTPITEVVTEPETPGAGASGRAVGRVVKTHGVRGEVVVDVSTDVPEHRFAEGATVLLTGRVRPERELTVRSARRHGERLLVAFSGVEGREAAEELRGGMLVTRSADLPPTGDPEEFYDEQLEGLAVSTVDGIPVGTVRDVAHGPGGELLVVDRQAGGGEAMIPFVYRIVTDVDLAAGTIRVDPPDGLLDL